MQVLGTGKTETLTKTDGHTNTIPLQYTWIWCRDYRYRRIGGVAASISGQSKSLDHKGNLKSALNNRTANLSPFCVPQYNVQRFPSTCGTSGISIQKLAVVLLRSEGRVKRRGERKVVACYVSISKSRWDLKSLRVPPATHLLTI